ncbi:MAG: cobalamin-dependent protein [Lachnospiraceae bacterium]|nr:cobalamin-dependent protein [Lachnospiraceae bacterium]
MKGLLLNSPIYRERSEFNEDYLPPLGLGYIATHLSDSGINVNIVDCVKERYGISEILELLREQQPEFMGINVFTQNYDIVKEIVENCPIGITLIIGGQVVKNIYADILQWDIENPLIIIIGEGEFILPAILNSNCSELPFHKTSKKEVYRVDKSSIYYPRDLRLVHLDRSKLKEDVVTNHYGEKEASLITSRGCLYNCAFCGGAHNLNRDITIRHRNLSDVEHEIYEITSLYPEVTSIRVLDDLFLRDEISINNAIEMFGKLQHLSWRGMAHILTFVRSFDSIPQLKQNGCREIFVGIESGSERIRKKIHKPGTVQQIEDIVLELLRSGIDVKGYFMFGFPNETVADAEATYLLASRLKKIACEEMGQFRLSVFQFRPYHGTELYNEILQSGRKISSIKSNETLNVVSGRSQFNFHSGNYSEIDDNALDEYILKTQSL